ncbi:hypothetical protein ACF0H5_017922 [Mactra antiquata]
MKQILIFAIFCGLSVCQLYEVGSDHCRAILDHDCSGYADEPVCVHNGHKLVTYMNSCEFAKGICSHHGHSPTAINEGPCPIQ